MRSGKALCSNLLSHSPESNPFLEPCGGRDTATGSLMQAPGLLAQISALKRRMTEQLPGGKNPGLLLRIITVPADGVSNKPAGINMHKRQSSAGKLITLRQSLENHIRMSKATRIVNTYYAE